MQANAQNDPVKRAKALYDLKSAQADASKTTEYLNFVTLYVAETVGRAKESISKAMPQATIPPEIAKGAPVADAGAAFTAAAMQLKVDPTMLPSTACP